MNTQNAGLVLEPKDENKILGARLKEAREYIGLKQGQVAVHLNIPRSGVSEIEKGKRSVSAIELKKLAYLYQRPIQYFAEEESAAPVDVEFLTRTALTLSKNDRQELQRFAEFLQTRSKS